MVDVRSKYKPSSPQQPMVKRRRLRLSSVPLVDLRSTSLPGTSTECAQLEARLLSASGSSLAKSSSHIVTLPHRPKTGLCSQGMENVKGTRGVSRFLTSVQEGQSRFPKLDECAHFHYEFVELGDLQVSLYDEPREVSKFAANDAHQRADQFSVNVTVGTKTWSVRRTYANFCLLDEQLHRCIYDRKFSLLPELSKELVVSDEQRESVRSLLVEYLERFSFIAGNLINCGPVLNWFELDNRGNRLIVTDDSAINTPAVAAAYVVKRYTAQAADEISFEVGDMISVIDMPPPEESVWWRGKKGFEVGFFPCECVELIGDKVPHQMHILKTPMKPVFRKHGKLISFFRSFILSRPSRRKLKQRGILKERVFGCDLGEHLLNSGNEIPMVLKCCSEFIEQHGIVDGIYRLSGITSNIQKLRIAFDEDRVPNLNDTAILQDIHCVASLLKMYFRELPNPLLTYQLYDKFVCAVQSSEKVRLMSMRDVVQQLPPPHYRTLEFLVKHLAKVASHGDDTGMTPKNVAIVWAPNLLRSKELEIGSVAALQVVGTQAIVTEYLIRYGDLIFNEKLPLFSSIFTSDGASMKGTRPKSLAVASSSKLLSLEEAQNRACMLSLQAKPKYIEVGGGPANLPSEYHTVIELATRKRGNVKLKKSPSAWKTFFGKGRSNSHSTKDKPKNLPKLASSASARSSQLGLEKPYSEVTRAAFAVGRLLRSVKSAESLSSPVTGHAAATACDIGATDAVDGFEADQEAGLASRMSMHSHVRSFSHDSYFEALSDISQRSKCLEEQKESGGAKEKRRSLERLIMDDFEDVALDMNQMSMNYDADFDILSTGTNEMIDSSLSQGDVQSPVDAARTVDAALLDGAVDEKPTFVFEEKLKQKLDACLAGRRTDGAAGSQLPGDGLSDCTTPRLQAEHNKRTLPSHSPQTKQQKCNSGYEEGSEWTWCQPYVHARPLHLTSPSPRTANGGGSQTVEVEVHVGKVFTDVRAPQDADGREETRPGSCHFTCVIGDRDAALPAISSCDFSGGNARTPSSLECRTSGPASQESSSPFSSILDTPTSFTSPQSDSQLHPVLADELDSLVEEPSTTDDASPTPTLSVAESDSSHLLESSWLWSLESFKESDAYAKDPNNSQERMETSTSTVDTSSGKADGTDVPSSIERLDSESSTPSFASEGGGINADEDRNPLFCYKILVDELEEMQAADGENGPAAADADELEECDEKIAARSNCQLESGHLRSCAAATSASLVRDADCEPTFVVGKPPTMDGRKDRAAGDRRLSSTSDQSQPPGFALNEFEEKFYFVSHLSPMDESKRKFESEIGRDILHERKMKLELEKIQSEHKCDRTCALPLEPKISPCALPPLSDVERFLERKLAPSKCVDRGAAASQLEGLDQEVELRRARNDDQLKRKSEPVGSENARAVAELKRHSEPSHAGSGLFGVKSDKIKGSVKELLTKFESGRRHGTAAAVAAKAPARHSSQSGESSLPDSKATLDERRSVGVEAISGSESKTGTANEATGCSVGSVLGLGKPAVTGYAPADSGASEAAGQASEFASLRPDAQKLLSRSLQCDPAHLEGESPGEQDSSLSSLDVAVQMDDQKECSKSVPSLTDDSGNDVARRERINRYKEERRAQLREKIRSESFKMDKNEKSEYLTRLKQKTTGSPRAPEEQCHGFRCRSRTVESKSRASSECFSGTAADFLDGVSKESCGPRWSCEQPSGVDKKKGASVENASVGFAGIASSDSVDQENLSFLTGSFLRTIPGRMNKRSDGEGHAPQLGRAGSLRERNRLQLTSNGQSSSQLAEAKEIAVRKPSSLPTKQRWRTSSERTALSGSQESHSILKDTQKSVPPPDDAWKRLRPRSSSWREESSTKAFKDSKTAGTEVVSPTRRIKEVAALFEKESAGTKCKVVRSLPTTAALAKTRHLPPASDRGAGRESFKKKPAQYTSAV